MTEPVANTGRTLERQVADAYRAIGARRVAHDVEIAGHQIDVYVELETADRSRHRLAIEAKDHARPVGIAIVADFADVVDGLRRRSLIDEGVVVSSSGFSRPARNAAREHGLRLLEPADLATLPQPSGDVIRDPGGHPGMGRDEGSPGAPAPLGPMLGSPFVVGRALRAGEPLFGRGTLMQNLAGQLANFNSVNVVGERRMGKTSLLHHLAGRQAEYLPPQPDQPPLILAQVDLQAGVSNAARFYGRALRTLLDRLPPDCDIEARDLQTLRERVRAHPEVNYDAFERALRHLRDPAGVCIRPVLLVDEFERLIEDEAREGFPYPDFFNGLRALITADLVAMMILSCRPLADYFRDPDRSGALTSTFPNYFALFRLDPLDEDAADDLLLQPSDHQLSLGEMTRAKRWAGGHPCHLQVAGQAWYETKSEGRPPHWARQRFEDLTAQACMVGGRWHDRPTRRRGVWRALKFVALTVPIRIGCLAQRVGLHVDNVAAWFIGMTIVIVIALVLLGAAKGSDVIAVLKRGLGLD